MKRFFLHIVLIFLPLLSFGAPNIPDSIEVKIKELVSLIDQSDVHIREKEEWLRELTVALDTIQNDPMQKFLSTMKIGGLYSSFITDSAILYFDKAIIAAEEMNRVDLVTKARVHQAKTLVTTGYFLEGYRLLANIEKSNIPEDLIEDYYSANERLYYAMSQHNIVPASMHNEFVAKNEAYRDSFCSVTSQDSPIALRYRERKAAREGRFDEAFEYNARRRVILGSSLNKNALVFYDKYALICRYQGRPIEDGIGELLTSAIIDVSMLNQDIASLLHVEQYLCAHNRYKEAKKVSDYYYSTMVRYGSKVRREDGFNQSMAINKNYVSMLTKNRHKLVAALIVVSILIVALIGVLMLVASSRRKLFSMNERLDRSDKIAKAYMTHFFKLYSAYIESMTTFKKRIYTLLHSGQVENATDMTAPSKENEWEELRIMMNNFDSAFISVYPNYVAQFNSMLKEQYHIKLEPNEPLTVELRIFALIKMGVEDSGEIANALHISIKTVYNKRSEIKNKLAIPHEEFLNTLREI